MPATFFLSIIVDEVTFQKIKILFSEIKKKDILVTLESLFYLTLLFGVLIRHFSMLSVSHTLFHWTQHHYYDCIYIFYNW